jgi:PAS domain S-box-containing protein
MQDEGNALIPGQRESRGASLNRQAGTEEQSSLMQIEDSNQVPSFTVDLQKSKEQLRTLIDPTDDAIVVLNGNIIAECNVRVEELFGKPADEIIGKAPWEVFSNREFGGGFAGLRSLVQIRKAYKQGAARFNWAPLKADGTGLVLEVMLTRINLAGNPRVVACVRDIATRNDAKLSLLRHIEFQTRLTSISNSLATVGHSNVDGIISQALHQIGDAYGLDRIRLWWDDRQTETSLCSHQWDRDGGMSIGRIVRTDELSWSRKELRASRCFSFHTIDDMPAEAEKEFISARAEGVKSLLGVPVIIDAEIVGSVSFVTTSKIRDWPGHIMAELQLLGQVLASSWQRNEYFRKLKENEADLMRSQYVAQIGIFSETALAGKSLLDGFGTSKFSHQACVIFGIEPGTETVELAISRIHPDDRDGIPGAVREVFRPGTVYTREYRVIRPDGSMVHVEDRTEVEHDDKNRVCRWFGTVQDVTNRVAARSSLESALDEVAALKDRLLDENLYLKREIRNTRRADKIIGENPQFRSVIVAAEKVAPTDVTVLILGETGTGKELIAREIHELSDRSQSPLISVNCAALSSELIESELFGHEAGAFTGAENQRIGRFELADKGTLFLDEIGDLSIDVQAKILRVLQTEDFERLGGVETLRVDVRVIAATNRNLGKMVETGEFRADLYYRINSFPIALPALRDRRSDISILTNFFVEKHAGHLAKEIDSVSQDMIHRLMQMDWPGNVRELESYVQRALIASTGPVLDYFEGGTANEQSALIDDREGHSVVHELDAIQHQHITRVLDRCGWVIGGENGAAVRIGMPPSTLRSRMKRLGIRRRP